MIERKEIVEKTLNYLQKTMHEEKWDESLRVCVEIMRAIYYEKLSSLMKTIDTDPVFKSRYKESILDITSGLRKIEEL